MTHFLPPHASLVAATLRPHKMLVPDLTISIDDRLNNTLPIVVSESQNSASKIHAAQTEDLV